MYYTWAPQEISLLLFYLIQGCTRKQIMDIVEEKLRCDPPRRLDSISDNARSLGSQYDLNRRNGKMDLVKEEAFRDAFLKEYGLPSPGDSTNRG